MPPQRFSSARERETVIQSTLSAVANGEFESVYHASQELNLPESSLYDHKRGVKSRVEARESQQNLTIAEEHALAKWVTKLTQTGYP